MWRVQLACCACCAPGEGGAAGRPGVCSTPRFPAACRRCAWRAARPASVLAHPRLPASPSLAPPRLPDRHPHLPHPAHHASPPLKPNLRQIDGDWRYDMRRGCLVWSIELIDDSNRTGSAEFVVPAAQPDAFFPIEARLFFLLPGCGCVVAFPLPSPIEARWLGAQPAWCTAEQNRTNMCCGASLLLRWCCAAQPRGTLLPPHAPQATCTLPPPSHPSCPPQVEFSAAATICDVRVGSVVDARSGQPVKYGSRTQLATEAYHVE